MANTHRGRGHGRARGGNRGWKHTSDRTGGHNDGDGRQSQDGSRQKERPPLSNDDQDYLTWRRGIPFKKTGQSLYRERMTPKKLSTFMQNAIRLIELRNDSIRQQVITELASEGGLLRVAELCEMDMTPPIDEEHVVLFEKTMLPFLQTVTNHEVLSSLLLEKPLGDLYVFMYGINGRRAITMFDFNAKVLEHMMHDNPNVPILPLASTILASLLQLLKHNQSAALVPDFLPIVDVLQACLDHQPEIVTGTLQQQASIRAMKVIRRILHYGQGVEPVDSSSMKMKEASFTFELSQDGPGSLSTAGQRHDNDHSSIENIRILPTAAEIRSPRSEYLPSKEAGTWHIAGICGLLDQQFRLLREDTIGQLRDCVRIAIEGFSKPDKKTSTSVSRNSSVRFIQYHHVSLHDVQFLQQKKQLIVVASLDQPKHLQNTSEKVRRLWWENSRQLQADSLVCLVDSDKNALFFSVYNPPMIPRQETAQAPKVREERTLWSDQTSAFVTLRLIDMDNPALVGILGRDPRGTHFQHVLVEFPGVLLPSFQPTLLALQAMSRSPDIPFGEILLGDSNTRGDQSAWPPYAHQPGFYFDLSPIAADDMPLRLSRNGTFDMSALKARTTLDDAQCKALVGALSRDLALMQGPPGTGKSFLAIQAVKVLLNCRDRARLNPIICV